MGWGLRPEGKIPGDGFEMEAGVLLQNQLK
jgi:hypothetical protein